MKHSNTVCNVVMQFGTRAIIIVSRRRGRKKIEYIIIKDRERDS